MMVQVIIIATILDWIIGDPSWLLHPVQIIGFFINKLEKLARKILKNNLKVAGVLITVVIVGLTYLISLFLIKWAVDINIYLGVGVEIILISLALATNSLVKEGYQISKLLKRNEIKRARDRIQRLVSRDLSKETENGLKRALLETLMENLSDGVIAPLFFAVIGGAPLAMAYKAINTMDSMLGYKDDLYKDIGWFPAKLDDVVNFIPARITGILIVITSVIGFDRPIKSIKAWFRDSQKGPSPNGGIPIVTFAGALDISLGGDCITASGEKVTIPQVGGERGCLIRRDINKAIFYIYTSNVLGLIFFLFFIL